MDHILYNLFQADQREITWWAMCFRGILTFFLAILMIRVGGKRMFGKQGAFDIVISIMSGTLMARAITGNSPYISTIITVFVLALLHRLLAMLTFSNKKFGNLIKGESDLLIKDGIPQYHTMKKHNITERDILEAVRSEGKISEVSKVKEAYLERSGKISIIPEK